MTLLVDGDVAGIRYAGPYAFGWRPARPGRYRLDVRAADAAGNVGRTAVVVDAAHVRRGGAAVPGRWIFTRARAQHGRAPARPARRPRG